MKRTPGASPGVELLQTGEQLFVQEQQQQQGSADWVLQQVFTSPGLNYCRITFTVPERKLQPALPQAQETAHTNQDGNWTTVVQLSRKNVIL